MNSFVATAPTQNPPEAPLSSSPFWPTIDPTQIRAAHRIDGTITPERLKDALIEAISSVNSELSVWREARMAEGYTTLADVPAEQVNDISMHVHRYGRAIGCAAKASLIERYRDYDTTAAGNKKADQLENPIDDLHRDMRWAISGILGIPRNTVELI